MHTAADGDTVALPGEAPVKKLLAEFMSSGGRVYVCLHCLGVAGMKNEDLVAGVQPMDGEQLLEQLDRGTIALSY